MSTPDPVAAWFEVARALPGAEFRLPLPLHALLAEAVDTARFVDRYYANVVDAETGELVRYGLVSANKAGLTPQLGADILALQEAAQRAHTAYLMVVQPRSEGRAKIGRARFVLGEIAATVRWFLDDGVRDDWDTRLEKLDAEHRDEPESADALAGALFNYATLAEAHRASLAGLGGFEAALIDEAFLLVGELRALPSGTTTTPEERQALSLRNRLLALLYERMQLVRAAARFVFRGQPQILREATSAYGRRQRAGSRRKAA
jgi:hypothetical protein